MLVPIVDRIVRTIIDATNLGVGEIAPTTEVDKHRTGAVDDDGAIITTAIVVVVPVRTITSGALVHIGSSIN